MAALRTQSRQFSVLAFCGNIALRRAIARRMYHACSPPAEPNGVGLLDLPWQLQDIALLVSGLVDTFD